MERGQETAREGGAMGEEWRRREKKGGGGIKKKCRALSVDSSRILLNSQLHVFESVAQAQ